MPVVRIFWKCLAADYEPLFVSCCDRDFATKLVTFVSLALADAGNIWLMKGVEFVFIFSLLSQDPLGLIENWREDFYEIF